MATEPSDPMSSGGGPKRRPRNTQGMLGSTFVVAKVKGIPIGAHWSWLFVFAYVVWILATQWFPPAFPELSRTTLIVMGIVSAVAFGVSVLLHELGHALVAVREGMKMDGITLWLFGGVAKFKGMFPSAGAEFRIAVAGPLVSLVLVGVFWGASEVGSGLPDTVRGPLTVLALINLVLLLFNLVPALPLDGGRILRAALWQRSGSFTSATRTAALAGKAFAGVLIGLGVVSLITDSIRGGILLPFIGLFLWQAARGEEQYALVSGVLQGMTVRDLMVRELVPVHPGLSLDAFTDFVGLSSRTRFPVVSEEEGLIGVISGDMVAELPDDDLRGKVVEDVMAPAAPLPMLDASESAREAMEYLTTPDSRVLVTEGGRIVGVVGTADLARAFQIGLGDARKRTKASPFAWTVVVLSVGLVVSALYYPPLLVQEPGVVLDVIEDIKLEGIDTTEINGRYLLTSVTLTEKNLISVAVAAFDPDSEIVPISHLYPEGIPAQEAEERSRSQFDESRTLAAVAAAEALGMEVVYEGTGARVIEAVEGAPADGLLQSDDVIIAVDDKPVRLSSQVQEIVRGSPAGTTFRFRVERGETIHELEIASEAVSFEGSESTAIGVLITTRDPNIELPFEISFEERNIGGPSAGLVYALAIADILDQRDIAGGRSIAASGTIDPDGGVGRVGGLQQKAIAALEGGASILLLPSQDARSVGVDGLTLIGVIDLDEALSRL